MMTKGLVRAAVLLALVGCNSGGGRRGPVDGGNDGGVAMGDAGGGKDAGDAQAPDDAGAADAVDSGGGDTGGAADAADGGPVSCTPGTKQCAGSTAEICVATGDAWN